MIFLKQLISRTLMVLSIILLAACGTTSTESVSSPRPDMSGYWDANLSFSVCGTSVPSNFYLLIEQNEGAAVFTGTATITLEELNLSAQLRGKVSEEGNLQGDLTINFSETTFSEFSLLLTYNEAEDQLTGKITEQLLTPCKDNSSSFGEFSGDFLPTRNDDFEPNNTFSDAKELKVGSLENLIFIDLNNEFDEDWFTFTLDDSKTINVRFLDVSPIRGTDYQVKGTFYNEKLENLGSFTKEYSELSGNLHNNNLLRELYPGKYYLKLENDYVKGRVSYSFEFLTAALKDAAFEPNDSFEKAFSINSGFDEILLSSRIFYIDGVTNLRVDSPDRDIFRLIMEEPGLIKMILEKFKAADEDSDYQLKLKLYNKEKQQLREYRWDDRYSIEEGPFEYFVEAGSYFLEVTGGVYTDLASYRLAVDTKEISSKIYEPNNTVSQAYELSMPFVSPELSLEKNDEDWFKLTLDQESEITLSVNNIYGFAEFRGFKANLDPIYFSGSCSGICTYKAKLGKGVYFFRAAEEDLPLDDLDAQIYQFTVTVDP